MVDYNIVKYCGFCRIKFIVNKSEAKRHLCDKCELEFNNKRNNWKEV